MSKSCFKCGTEPPNDKISYPYGENKFEGTVTPSVNQTSYSTDLETTPYSPQPPTSPAKPGRKKIIAAVAIAMAACLIAAALFVFMGLGKTEFEKLIDEMRDSVDEYSFGTAKTMISGGPTVSLMSLASGNFQSIPADGCIGKYGIYYNGEKVGTSTEETVGTENYRGADYLVIKGRGDVNMYYGYQDIAFIMDYTYFVEKETKIPVFMTMTYDYSEPEELEDMDITTEITWNKDTGEIKTSIPSMGVSSEAKLPADYWGMISSVDDLYIGYNKEFDYTITTSGQEVDVTMSISVSSQEDVTVAAGTFEDCYVVVMEQAAYGGAVGSMDFNFKVWISQEGVVPKSESSMSTMGSMNLIAELEGYYTT